MTILSDEITNDPLAIGYSTMTDAQVASSLNETNRPEVKQFLSGSDIFNATDDIEYAALTAAEKASWDALCAIDSINTSSGVAKSREAELFGAGTATRSNLQAARQSTISRAQELGISKVSDADVTLARTGGY